MSFQKLIRAKSEVKFRVRHKEFARMSAGQIRLVNFDTRERYLSLLRRGVVEEYVRKDTPKMVLVPNPYAVKHIDFGGGNLQVMPKLELVEVDLSYQPPVSQGSPK